MTSGLEAGPCGPAPGDSGPQVAAMMDLHPGSLLLRSTAPHDPSGETTDKEPSGSLLLHLADPRGPAGATTE